MKFSAFLFKLQKDADGKVKIIFVVSKTEVSSELMLIPEEKELEIEVTQK